MNNEKDKNIPLMKPTFFEEDDKRNPKYVDKKERLQELGKIANKEMKKYAIKLPVVLIIALICVMFGIQIIYNITSNALLSLSVIVPASMISFFIIMKDNVKLINLFSQVDLLRVEIQQDELKEKIKSLSKEDKKVLKKVIKNPELNSLSEKVLEEYEKENTNLIKEIEDILFTDENLGSDEKEKGTSLSLGTKEK